MVIDPSITGDPRINSVILKKGKVLSLEICMTFLALCLLKGGGDIELNLHFGLIL